MNGGRIWGRLTLEGDEHPIAIRDKRLAAWVASVVQREPRVVVAFNELADYRLAWQELTARHNRLERCGWSRLGRWLRLAPNEHAGQAARRVIASEVAATMPAQPQANGTAPSSLNGASRVSA